MSCIIPCLIFQCKTQGKTITNHPVNGCEILKHLCTNLFCNMVWFCLPLAQWKHYSLFILMKTVSSILIWGMEDKILFWILYRMLCFYFPPGKKRKIIFAEDKWSSVIPKTWETCTTS